MAKHSVRTVSKPWGYEIIYAHGNAYVGKILHIQKGCRLSRQYHEKKDETIYVHSGSIQLELGGGGGGTEIETLVLEAGESHHLPPRTVHRMTAIEDSDILEVSTPELDDVVRIEDDYGRA